jgi:hypothetical protein
MNPENKRLAQSVNNVRINVTAFRMEILLFAGKQGLSSDLLV